MIGRLQGIVDYTGDGFSIIMTGGVGYKVFCPDYLTPGDAVKLWIETVVREDSIRLFGFTSGSQNELFNQLTGVSGVGPKVAMAILSAIKPDLLISAIASGDAKTITSAPGVGKKVADKIILELSGKIANAGALFMTGDNNLSDLLAALETLGYKRIGVLEMAQKLVAENPGISVSKLVPIALKQITAK